MRRLKDYFDRIEASIAAGEAILAQRDPSLSGTVKAKCTEAALLVGSYHMFVHREVFEPLMASADDRVRQTVYTLKIESIALGDDLRAAVKALAAQETSVDYDTLSARVKGFNTRVRCHIAAIANLLESPNGTLLAA